MTGPAGIPTFDALTLDVGGVFVVPRHDVLHHALARAGVEVAVTRFVDAHYLAMHAVDAEQSPAETFDTYVTAFCHQLDLPADDRSAAVTALDPLFGPSELWMQEIEGSIEGLRALHRAGIPMAMVTNADGSAVRLLAEVGVCQVGEGPCTPVAAVIDSGAVGVAKPDPRIFHRALDALGTDPARTLHVGDSVHYDVRGAEAAGMPAAHFDPRRLCRATDHPHIAALTDLLPG